MKKCILPTRTIHTFMARAWWVLADNKLVNEDKKICVGKNPL
jgi:hypothetical protein